MSEAAVIETVEDQESAPITYLRADLKRSAALMGVQEVRYLVDLYYQIQDYRKATDNQRRSMTSEPTMVFMWTRDTMARMEADIKSVMDAYTSSDPMGQWSKSIVGIGPVLAAGLSANIDITKAPTVGHIWRFAGLDPTATWLGREKAAQVVKTLTPTAGHLTDDQIIGIAGIIGRNPESLLRQSRYAGPKKAPLTQPTAASTTAALARRPWNAALKLLCWKIGDSFVKVSNHPNDVYGHYYRQRKDLETQRNLRGEYADKAREILDSKRIGKDTENYKHLTQGHLSPGHIDARARRWAVKLFLAHWHETAYRLHYKTEPPAPYPIAILGHAHRIAAPSQDLRVAP